MQATYMVVKNMATLMGFNFCSEQAIALRKVYLKRARLHKERCSLLDTAVTQTVSG